MESLKSNERFKSLCKRVRNRDNGSWWFFGNGVGEGSKMWDPNKCQRCTEYLRKTSFQNDIESSHISTNKPCKEMLTCWKIEIWENNLTSLEEVMIVMFELCVKDDTLHCKLSSGFKAVWQEEKGDRLSSCNSHSIPEKSKPEVFLNGKIEKDRVILIYEEDIERREKRRKEVFDELTKRNLYKNENLPPFRRGCIHPHEKVFGPWEKWYKIDKEYYEEEKVETKKPKKRKLGEIRTENCCWNCGDEEKKLLVCSECKIANYCSKTCQINDWKNGGHKKDCKELSKTNEKY